MASSRAASNVIIGGVLLHLALGTLYSWGCIQPYVTSYIRLHHPHVTNQDTTMIYACAILGQSITMPLVGLLQFSLGLRGCAAFGACLVGFATLASALATSVTGLSVLNGAFGVGIAFAYTCPLVSGYAWMPDRKGTVSGFIVAGFGAGAAVFNVVATAWVNPNNITPDPETGYYGEDVAGRVPGMYLILGTCYLCLGLLGSWMITTPPANSEKGTVGDNSPVRHKAPPPSNGRSSLAGYENLGSGGSLYEMRREHGSGEETEYHLRRDSSTSHQLLSKEAVGDGMEGDYERGAMSGTVDAPDGEKPFTAHGSAIASSAGIDRGRASSDGSLGVVEEEGGCVQGSTGAGVLQHRHQQQQRQFEVWDLLREVDFYHLSLSMMLTAVSGLFIAGNYKHIAQQHFPDSDHFLSIMGSFASLFNASGRVIGGMALDRFGCLATLFVMTTCMGCLLLTYKAAQTSWPSFFLVICLLHMLYGSNFAIYPTLTAELFGATTAGPNYGLVFMGYGLGSFVGMLCLAGLSGSNQVFLACAAFNFMGAFSVALFWERRRRHKMMTS